MLFLNFLNNNDGLIALISLIASVVLVIVYVGIYRITKRYTKATNELAESSAESIRVTKEKENLERTLGFLKNIDHEKYSDIIQRYITGKSNLQNGLKDIEAEESSDYKKIKNNLEERLNNYYLYNEFHKEFNELKEFLHLLDTISIFRVKGKLDEEVFKAKIEGYFLSVILHFTEDIKKIIKDNYNKSETISDNYNHFVIVLNQAVKEKIYLFEEKIKKGDLKEDSIIYDELKIKLKDCDYLLKIIK